MKTFQGSNQNEQIPGLILCSHGPLAIGLLQSLEMLAGDVPNICAFSLEPGDDVVQYRQAVVSQLEVYPKGTIIFVDLLGGTPCNQLLQYVQESGKVIEIITGMNLPIVLNAVLMRQNQKGNDFFLSLIADGKQSIGRVELEQLFMDDEDEDED